MARTADDCGLVLDAIAGHDPLDFTMTERKYKYEPSDDRDQKYRLAVVADSIENIQPEVLSNFNVSLDLLRERATIEMVSLPDLPYGAVIGTTIDCELGAAFEGLLDDNRVWQMTAPEDRIGLHAEQFIPAKDYINAQRIRRIIQREVDKVLAPYDAVVMPARAGTAPANDRPFNQSGRRWKYSVMGGAENAAGVPSLTILNGFDDNKLPTAIHFIARAFEENRVLALGRYLQNKTDWHRRRPTLG
jgi:aspartyl-tRNA(Asn)/glutamyl-tRNA(Gln) amidotransferase subunit A